MATIGLIFGVEEFILTLVEFDKILALAFLGVGLTSLIPTITKRNLDPNCFHFNKNLFYFSLIIQFVMMGLYIGVFSSGCSKVEAYESGSCLFPDWFNHNAVLHVVIALGMSGFNYSFFESN